MIKIPSIDSVKLKRGEIKLAHFPNKTLCWISKNLVDEIRCFSIDNTYIAPKIVIKFAKSKSFRY